MLNPLAFQQDWPVLQHIRLATSLIALPLMNRCEPVQRSDVSESLPRAIPPILIHPQSLVRCATNSVRAGAAFHHRGRPSQVSTQLDQSPRRFYGAIIHSQHPIMVL